MRVLIVDDDLSTRKLLQVILSKYAECELAEDGRQGVEKIKQSFIDKTPYDIIFLDIMMPELNGHEVLVELRKIEEKHGILLGHGAKVVMETCLNDNSNILDSFREGCEYFMVKPFSKQKVLDLLEQMECNLEVT